MNSRKKSAPSQVFLALLLDLDVQQAEGVKSEPSILPHALQPRVGAPRVGEEGDGDGLAVVVEGESDGTNGIHDRGVVDHGVGDLEGVGAEKEVGVGGGAMGEQEGLACTSINP